MTQEKQNSALDVNDALSKSEALVVKHKKSILIAVVALIVVFGGFFAIKYGYLNPRENKAQTLLAMGQNYLNNGEYEKALNGEAEFPGYLKIANEYSFTDAANLAHAYAGICYAKLDKVVEAIAELEKFSAQSDMTVSPAILGTLANCYATNNNVDKAVETFKEAAKLADNASFSPVFLIEAGKLLESQGKTEEALKLYTEVKENYPTSAQAAPMQQNGKNIAPEINKYIERVSK